MPRVDKLSVLVQRTALPRDRKTGHLICNGRLVRCPVAKRGTVRPGAMYGPIVSTMGAEQIKQAGLDDLWPEDGKVRQLPATRGDCPTVRPCPYLTCKYNLGLHLESDGKRMRVHRVWKGIFRNTSEAVSVGHTCALDAAEAGGMTLEVVGQIMGITRERVRQIELVALRKLRLRINFPVNLFAEGPSLGSEYGDPRGRNRKTRNIGYTPEPIDLPDRRRGSLDHGEFFAMFEHLEEEDPIVKTRDMARMLNMFPSKIQQRVHASKRLAFVGAGKARMIRAQRKTCALDGCEKARDPGNHYCSRQCYLLDVTL